MKSATRPRRPTASRAEAQLTIGGLFGTPGERELLSLAAGLGARGVGELSPVECALLRDLPTPPVDVLSDARERIERGGDPLGDLFCLLRAPAERREQGAVYTPRAVIRHILGLVATGPTPARVVDPGAGSGRFLVEAGRVFPDARLVAVELDPVAALLCRAHLAAAGLGGRSEVLLADYRSVNLAPAAGTTLFVGNPPYVRHHQIDPEWKAWLVAEAGTHGIHASQLAGLHAYFFLATARHARAGDQGAFITSAEWLDVNYGSLIRGLLLNGLGAQRIEVVEPSAAPFPDAMTTAVITKFEVGRKPRAVQMLRLSSVPPEGAPEVRRIRRERLEAERRWSHLTRPLRDLPEGFVELGEICRVHRGQVTGANDAWIEGPHSASLPEDVLFPTVTRARELFESGLELAEARHLRRVIDLPEDLSAFTGNELRAIERFLKRLRQRGVHEGYVASHRRSWWSVGLRAPAPILATYMARRPPAFVRNRALARHINIAHGLYPRDPLPEPALRRLAEYLSASTRVAEGRTYAGGLTKFEPREMERLLVPAPHLLLQQDTHEATSSLVSRGA